MKGFEDIRASLKSVKNILIFMIVAAIAIGLIYIFSPHPATKVICYIIASILCAYGVYSFVAYFVKSKLESFGSFGLVKGLSLILVGVVIFLNPKFVSEVMAVLIGGILIIDGLAKAQYSVDLLRLKAATWWYLLVPAAIVIILGIVVVCNSDNTDPPYLLFVGISLIVDALTNIFAIIYLSATIKKIESEETGLVKVEE